MENELIMSTMLSEKGEILKVVNDFKFGCHKNYSNGDIRWRCTNKNCRAFLRIDAEDKIKVSASNIIHNHDKIEVNILNRQKFSNSLKRKAISDVSERPSKLFHTQLKEENVPTLTLTDVTYIKNNMHYARRTSYPQLPNNINEVHSILNCIEIKTIDNEEFVLFNNSDNGIVMFSCQSNLSFFSKISVFYVDGTFDYCTKFFCQLFTIHGLHNGFYIPLVFFLLKDKQTLSYFEAFKAINHEITKINPIFTPKIIYVDFEKAIHNAINRIWPTTLIRGCRFHLGQSWWRKIQELGLASDYILNNEIGKYLTLAFGLSFLEPHEVGDFFSFEMSAIQPDEHKTIEFANYLVDTYISENSIFPPELWAEKSCSSQRTTNACESFHSKFKKCFDSPHPNIYKFIEVLKNMQTDTTILIRSSLEKQRVPRKAIRQRIIFIENKIKQLNNNEITIKEYVNTLANKYKYRQ